MRPKPVRNAMKKRAGLLATGPSERPLIRSHVGRKLDQPRRRLYITIKMLATNVGADLEQRRVPGCAACSGLGRVVRYVVYREA
jgi:hypothetical protein